ncbi:UNVERIFIED_CONTAM: hypothetical protein NCL1_30985 [Trichonephila clavipes]
MAAQYVLYLLKRTYQRYRLRHDLRGRAQSSIMMHPVSTTQVSSMAETTQTNHHGLHYRTKSGDKHLDIATSVTEANAFEDVTLV